MNIKADSIIAVKDVEASSNWYQALLNCRGSHGGDTFEILADEDNSVLLCLHKWGEDEHPTMLDSTITPGNGLILYFRTKNFKKIRDNAKNLAAHIEEDIHLNPNSRKKNSHCGIWTDIM